ncbi:MAG: type II secretion system F family protein [bacterium]
MALFKKKKIKIIAQDELPANEKVVKAPVAKPAKKRPFEGMTLFSSTKFSIKKQTFFAKRLSFLIKAGVPMLESVIVIRKQTKSRGEIRVFERVIGDISNGQTLATSLGKFRGVFGNFAINLIKAGESSGTLTQNLAYLADELRKKEMLKKKIMGALLYPIIVTVATFGITGFLAVYIFPKILPIFQSLNAKLPASTRAIIWLTETLKKDGLWIFLGLAAVITTIVLLVKKSKKVAFFWDGLILHLPFSARSPRATT